jgi:hypothetical protein
MTKSLSRWSTVDHGLVAVGARESGGGRALAASGRDKTCPNGVDSSQDEEDSVAERWHARGPTELCVWRDSVKRAREGRPATPMHRSNHQIRSTRCPWNG